MPSKSIILFGKHPAWSDHIFLPGDGGYLGSCLKREFYDRSVVGASTSGIPPERFADYSFLFNLGTEFTIAVGVPSRDSVGRSRFPLFAAIPLDVDAFDNINVECLFSIREALRKFLDALLDPASSESMNSREAVEAACASFELPELEGFEAHSKIVETSDFIQLLRGLSAGERSFCLAGSSHDIILAVAECGCRQFRTRPCALLALGNESTRSGFFISGDNESGFALSSFLFEEKPDFRQIDWPNSEEVGTVTAAVDGSVESIQPSSCPRLGLAAPLPPKYTKFRTVKLRFFLLTLCFIMLGLGAVLFLVNKNGTEGSTELQGYPEAMEKTRRLWTETASNYLVWVEPMLQHMDTLPSDDNLLKDMRRLGDTAMNPFVLFDNKADRHDLIENPGRRIYRSENIKTIKSIAANQQKFSETVKKTFERLDPSVFNARLRDKGIDLKETGQNDVENVVESEGIVFDSELVEDFQRTKDEYQKRAETWERFKAFEKEVLDPIRSSIPDFAARVLATLNRELRSGTGDASSVFNAIREHVEHEWLLNPNSVDTEALVSSEDWPEVMDGPATFEGLAEQVAYVRGYERMADERFETQIESVQTTLGEVEEKLERARTKFPDEEFLREGASQALVDIREDALGWSELPKYRKNYDKIARQASDSLKSLNRMRQKIDEQLRRLTDPDLWVADIMSELNSVTDEKLRDKLESLLNSLQTKYSVGGEVDRVEAYEAFDRDAERLRVGFQRFEQAFSKWEQLETGMRWDELKPSVSREIVDRVEKFADSDDPAGKIDKVTNPVIASVEKDIKEFAKKMKRAQASYLLEKDSGAVTRSELLQTCRELRSHTLGGEKMGRREVSILEIASSAQAIEIMNSVAIRQPDLFWILRGAMEGEYVDAALLKTASDAAEKFSVEKLEANRSLRDVWEQALARFISKQNQTTLDFFKLGTVVDSLIPRVWLTDSHQIWRVASEFRLELEDLAEEAVPSAKTLRERADDATEPSVAKFWGRAADHAESLGVAEGAQVDGLSRMVEASPLIKNAEISEDFRTIDIDLSNDRKLRFLLLDEVPEPFFISASPLTVSEFFALFSVSGIDFSELLQPYWTDRYPKTFNITHRGAGFSATGDWKFGPKKKFSVFDALPPEEQVMYLVQPSMAARLAEALDVRLPKPEETTALINLQDVASRPVAPADFSDPELRSTLRSQCFEYSVYAESLEETEKSSNWSGGIEFDRVPELAERNRFYNVRAGTAELSYDGENYYAQGASWLYSPRDNEHRVILSDKTVYIDLGLRFAFAPPKRSLRHQFQEWLDEQIKKEFK